MEFPAKNVSFFTCSLTDKIIIYKEKFSNKNKIIVEAFENNIPKFEVIKINQRDGGSQLIEAQKR